MSRGGKPPAVRAAGTSRTAGDTSRTGGPARASRAVAPAGSRARWRGPERGRRSRRCRSQPGVDGLPSPHDPGHGSAGRTPRGARRLAAWIEPSAEQGERDRRLPEPVVEALLGADPFRLLLPRWLDGAELDPAAFVRVLEDVSRADASTAWCLCQAAGCSMVAAYLAPPVARKIFRGPRAILAWGPEAPAIPVDGGYRVSGTWSFASGCHHATWLGGLCRLQGRDGTPLRRPDGALQGR
jgi:hypothetical protein